MSRAEHFATLGELAAGLAHEIRNPLAGIASVLDIASRDLLDTSPARSVMEDAKQEAVQINRILTELLDTARPKPPQFRVLDIVSTADQLANIFRPFYTTKGHGTGLGLSLARRIVQSHGGTISVQSTIRGRNL